jgi:hypothetical protein
VKRPSALGLRAAKAGRAGATRRDRRRRTAPARLERRPHSIRFSIWCAAIARHEVSERIGLGRSSRRGSCVSQERSPSRREAPDGESPPAPGPRNLGWWSTTCRMGPHRGLHSSDASAPGRKARAGVERRATPPGSGGRQGGWLQPHPEVSSQPSASWGRRVDELGAGIGRSCGCARGLQLVAEVDERHLVQVSHRGGQPPRRALGLAYRPRARYGEGVLEAGSRRQSRGHGGGLSMILRAARAASQGREHSSREGVLVSAKRRVFDETAAEAVPGGLAGEIRPKGRIGSRGAATEGVRGYVASSARGRKRRSREVQRGGAFDRSSARTAWHHELTPARSG